MPYSQFTLTQSIAQFNLTFIEGGAFLTPRAIAPSPYLLQTLERDLLWAIAVGTEKSRSEGIIHPILLELRERFNRKISIFSGTEFDVDASQGLSGYCDYLISRSPQQSFITAPLAVAVEAKKGDLNLGLGQCAATMVAAQRFNEQQGQSISPIYGTVSSGNLWKFLRLDGQQLVIDLNEYPIQPIEQILGIFFAMLEQYE